MTSSKYYIDELTYLREMGREFALAHPQAAPLLAEAGADPDVERLLEGFAFLTAQVREKLDDEQGYYNQQLIQFMWPHYLRPVPSATIVQFTPKAMAARETRSIPVGAPLASKPVDGTACQFMTTAETVLSPLAVLGVAVSHKPTPSLRLRIGTTNGATFADLRQSHLRLHLAGERAVSRALYGTLLGHVQRIHVSGDDGKPSSATLELAPVGFAADQALVPGMEDAFPAFRLIQEYLSFPQKFMFVDLLQFDQMRRLGGATSAEIVFELDRFPDDMPPLTTANIQLHCVPAVNVFAHQADPLNYDPRRVSFKLRPSGADQHHYDIYRIESVRGTSRTSGKSAEYRKMFRPGRRGEDRRFYVSTFSPSPVVSGNDYYLGLLDTPDGEAPPDVVSVGLTCTNRQLPSTLAPGDLSIALPGSPSFVTFRNLTRPTPSYPPPPPGELYWRLISHFGLGHASLCSADSLRDIVRLYDFPALSDRQLGRAHDRLFGGIEQVKAEPSRRLYRGAPVRGLDIEVRINEEQAGGEGELYLFGSVLNELFANCVTLNSYTRLRVVGTRSSEVFAWPARLGQRAIL